MSTKKITVIGCGWLGLPLCEKLTALGHTIVTTTTSLDKQKDLEKKFESYLFDVTKDNPDSKLLDSDILIYTIPPLGKGEVETFFNSIDSNKKILFISSTSVYGKNQGDVTEEKAFDPNSKNALVLREAEIFLKKRFKNLTIIRPGGLYDEKRHPVYFLAGKTGLTTGDEYLHLVHRDDCINAIMSIIEKNIWNEEFNLVNDLRVKKEEYYIEIAKKLKLEPPQYLKTPISNPTKISNEKSKKLLSLKYINLG